MANAWIDETLPPVISSLTTKRFKSQFSALTTNADRVQFCLSQKEVQRWVGLFVSKFSPIQNSSKCTTTAVKNREKGNDHFCRQNLEFENALQLCSKAICFASQTMNKTASELALSYANRSAVYFQLGQYENALKDINDALAFGYGRPKSMVKLQLRKYDCLFQMGRTSEAKEFLNFMQLPTSEVKETKRWIDLFDRISLVDHKKKDESISKKNGTNQKVCNVSLISKLTNKGLFKSNEKMFLFSTKVAVQYDEVKGRHLVAQEDIQFGDILALSRPYVSLLDSKVDALKHCHHCCGDISLESSPIRPIPCTFCSSVVFCTEECRTESANSYHRYECGQHDLLVQLPKFARMSLRLLYCAGIDQIRSVVNSSPVDANHLSEQPEGHYSHVYQLVHHSNGRLKGLNISFEEILKSSILACLLLQLVKNGHFAMKTKEDEKLIGGILLRHLLQSRYNTFDYSPFNQIESSSSPVLLDLFPMLASTLNHSCKANARLESENNQHVCLLQAARPIPAGTEITISYLEDQQSYPSVLCDTRISRRQQQLHERYGFHCNCAKCKYEIRNMPFGLFDYHPLQCDRCGNLIERFSEHCSISEVFRCTNCPLKLTSAQVKQRYVRIEDSLNTLAKFQRRLGQSNRQSIKDDSKFAPIIDEIKKSLYRDWSTVLGIQLLSYFYRDKGLLEFWWTYQETFFQAIEHHFGAESLQFIQAFEMFRRLRPSELATIVDLMGDHGETVVARSEQCKQLKRKYYPY